VLRWLCVCPDAITIPCVTSDADQLATADLQRIVALIYGDWSDINASAATYLHALDINDCRELEDPVGNETADIQLRYFLTYAAAWRGPTARAVKRELRRRLGLRS
jgi:hypothetical protein